MLADATAISNQTKDKPYTPERAAPPAHYAASSSGGAPRSLREPSARNA